jgi:hypothetical protein
MAELFFRPALPFRLYTIVQDCTMLPAQIHPFFIITSVLAWLAWAARVDACGGVGAAVPCFPRAGDEPKDWVFGLILPRSTGFITVSNNGVETDNNWTFWPHSMREPSPLYQTFDQFTILDPYMIYNDQMENPVTLIKLKTEAPTAHSKGFLHQTKDGGLWLHHSVPRFLPMTKENKDFDGLTKDAHVKSATNVLKTETAVGQHFFMVKLEPPLDPLNGNVVDIMNVAHTNIWRNRRSQFQFGGVMPLEAGIDRPIGKFRAFAVSSTFNGDIARYLAAKLRVPLSCTSWPGVHAKDDMMAHVEGVNGVVRNIRLLRTPAAADVSNSEAMLQSTSTFKEFTEYTWGNSYDHSKWCVQYEDDADKKYNWVCVRGSNRESRQVKRGTDALCVDDKALNGLLRKLQVVVSTQVGPNPPVLKAIVAEDNLPQDSFIKAPEMNVVKGQKKESTTKAVLALLNIGFNAYTTEIPEGNEGNGGEPGAHNMIKAFIDQKRKKGEQKNAVNSKKRRWTNQFPLVRALHSGHTAG